MKLRIGFVTNSSSTNHIILWKGKGKDLLPLFIKYKEDYLKEFRPNCSEPSARSFNIEELKELANAIIYFAVENKSLGVSTAAFKIGTEDDCDIQPKTGGEEDNWDYPIRVSYEALKRFYGNNGHINKEDLTHSAMNW